MEEPKIYRVFPYKNLGLVKKFRTYLADNRPISEIKKNLGLNCLSEKDFQKFEEIKTKVNSKQPITLKEESFYRKSINHISECDNCVKILIDRVI